mmetsp:Transcript_26940/g.77301  ORF Transcript_26940/g.77301 Transcript_26940/m.77301 type:complete len:764 (+) Transcript_26940:48-2339(+)
MYSTPWRAVLSSHVALDGAPAPAPEKASDPQASSDDLGVFLAALNTNASVLVAAVLAFCILRRLVPQVFSNNVLKKDEGGMDTAPFKPADSFFGGIIAGFGVTLDQTKESAGLDAAMVLEFAELARRILATIGLPLLFIMCPLHFFFGGDRAYKDGDYLSSIGLNNVEDGSWLFWVHAGIVWYVIVVSEEMIFESMARFLDMRFQWLLDFQPPQAFTILVENIPPAYRCHKALKSLFCKMFPDCVESTGLVKNTKKLKPIVTKLKAQHLRMEILTYKRDHKGSLTPKEEKELEDLEADVDVLATEARVHRDRILTARDESGTSSPKDRRTGQTLSANTFPSENTASGFVTFVSQREALIALHTRFTADAEEFVMSIPPQPSDIIYEDLMVPKFQRKIWDVLGGVCIFLLFWFFLPLVMLISSFTNLKVLEAQIPMIHDTLEAVPGLRVMIDGVLSTLALVLMMGFLPTFLMLIFDSFFSLKAYAWAQLKLQRYYFAFLVTFVLLTTAIGNSIYPRAVEIYQNPPRLLGILADALPSATNFYLDYMLVQVMLHGVNLTRYVQLMKWWSFKLVLGPKRACELAEPEDQDYYGIGARSARWALDLVIALVFCTLCPLITFVTMANFAVGRGAYGYLMVFAETRKADLGGPFFVQQLYQVQFGLGFYSLLMIGIFLRRAQHWGPALISFGAMIYVIYSTWRFSQCFLWENLPMMDIVDERAMEECNRKMATYRSRSEGISPYVQPELLEDNWLEKIASSRLGSARQL